MSTAFAKFTPQAGVLPALSIRQPWAGLIVQGVKDLENRDWKTDYRGPLLIHAGKEVDASCFDGDELHSPALYRAGASLSIRESIPLSRSAYPTGGIVGRVTLVDVVTSSKSPWFVGRYGFVLKDAQPLPFVSYRGQLGLFELPESELVPKKSLDEVLQELAEASQKKGNREYKPRFWQLPNAPVWVTIGKETYAGEVLEYAHLGDFNGNWCRLRLSKTVKLWDGTYSTYTWEHPEPVQSYKLRKRLE